MRDQNMSAMTVDRTRRRLLMASGLAAALAGCQTFRKPRDEPAPPVLATAPTPPPPPPAAPPPPPKPPRLGLALGGGAARGFAHIGVIQVLEESGLRPDLVVGTSAGSLVAALYASGKS